MSLHRAAANASATGSAERRSVNAPAKNLIVVTTNSNYQKMGGP